MSQNFDAVFTDGTRARCTLAAASALAIQRGGGDVFVLNIATGRVLVGHLDHLGRYWRDRDQAKRAEARAVDQTWGHRD